MPSATLVHSFPVPLGRRGSAAVAVVALHIVLVAALITGIAVQLPKVDVSLAPPAVRAPPRPEPPLGHAADSVRNRWTFSRPPVADDVVLPPLPVVTPGGDVAPPPVVEVGPPVAATSTARVLRSEEPPYPAAARRLGEQGAVLVRVLVGADGRAERVEIASSSGSSRLDEAALASVRRWLFAPANAGAGPVASWTTLRIVFRLTS
jgi:protein TonB